MRHSSLRLASLVASIMIGGLSTTAVRAAVAGDSVYLPCADFSVGSSRAYVTKSPYFTEMASVMVVENAGNKIRVAEKKTQKPQRLHPRSPEPSPQSISGETQYQVVGSTIFQSSITFNDSQTLSDPSIPYCGQIPSKFFYTSKVTARGYQGQSTISINARALGKETVTVPAGTYDATVVELRSKTSDSNRAAGGDSSTTTLIYAVKGIGIVKTVTKVVSKMPVAVGESDPRSDALIPEGLAKMQKGEDISDVMKKMEKIPVPEIKMEKVVNIMVMELQSYAPAR